MRRSLVAATLAATSLTLSVAASPSPAHGTESSLPNCAVPTASITDPAAEQPSRPLHFGVTDNHPTPSTVPLLHRLGHLKTFGIHDYTGPTRGAAYFHLVYPELHSLARRGFPVTLDVGVGEVNGVPTTQRHFVSFIRRLVRKRGHWLHAIEITNEPNVPSPTTSDGANPGVVGDLVAGVLAAHHVAHRLHLSLKVGFNVAYGYGSDIAFWSLLKAAETARFLRDVDWVGLHTYPNFFSSDFPVNPTEATLERQGMATARACMSMIGLARHVPIDITEVGFPTSHGTAEYTEQRDYWKQVLTTVGRYGPAYGVRGLFLFLLQDAPTTSAVGTGYGVFDATGKPKPAEHVVKRLFAKYGSGHRSRSRGENKVFPAAAANTYRPAVGATRLETLMMTRSKGIRHG